MNNEDTFIQKSFFETLVKTDEEEPFQVLGEMFFKEQENEIPDLSSIRFAQGEIYFHIKDFEAAIFKWENVRNELEPWAKKNMADAYFELSLLNNSEEIYQSITTNSLTLNTLIALKLFELYKVEHKFQDASEMIKNAVILNPDYPNVTAQACNFFEERKDWNSAIELAINESIRTKTIKWFEKFNFYIDSGYATGYEPDYFIPVLTVIAEHSHLHFQNSVAGLWSNYQNDGSFLNWLHQMNQLILKLKINSMPCPIISNCYKSTLKILFSEPNQFMQMRGMVKDFLEAWLKVSDSSTAVYASTAILAWNDYYPNELNKNSIEMSEQLLFNTQESIDILEECQELFQEMRKWGKTNGISMSKGLEWRIQAFHDKSREAKRIELDKLLSLLEETVSHLFEEQLQVEKELTDSIESNEQILARLNGSVNQLNDIEEETVRVIKEAYVSLNKDIKKKLTESIPKLIKESSEIINEKSDFRKIHLELNDEMNRRIETYLVQTIIPIYAKSLNDWISFSESELKKGQTQLFEWRDGFNSALGEDTLELMCNEQIITDWKRDVDRLTSTFQYNKEKIFPRKTPSQVLLKNAGKLIGALPKNNLAFVKTYKSFIQNELYEEVIESVTENFFRQFDLFERAIARDINLYFQEPSNQLKETIGKVEQQIAIDKRDLANIQSNPEVFQDSIALFKYRIRQYEWIQSVNESLHTTNK